MAAEPESELFSLLITSNVEEQKRWKMISTQITRHHDDYTDGDLTGSDHCFMREEE
jgi:hypothetical protein